MIKTTEVMMMMMMMIWWWWWCSDRWVWLESSFNNTWPTFHRQFNVLTIDSLVHSTQFHWFVVSSTAPTVPYSLFLDSPPFSRSSWSYWRPSCQSPSSSNWIIDRQLMGRIWKEDHLQIYHEMTETKMEMMHEMKGDSSWNQDEDQCLQMMNDEIWGQEQLLDCFFDWNDIIAKSKSKSNPNPNPNPTIRLLFLHLIFFRSRT